MANNNTVMVSVTLASDSSTVLIRDEDILWAVTDTLGSAIWYTKGGKTRAQIVVTDSLATLTTASDWLLSVTPVGESAMRVNASRIIKITTDTLGSTIEYDADGAGSRYFVVSESVSTLNTAINNL